MKIIFKIKKSLCDIDFLWKNILFSKGYSK